MINANTPDPCHPNPNPDLNPTPTATPNHIDPNPDDTNTNLDSSSNLNLALELAPSPNNNKFNKIDYTDSKIIKLHKKCMISIEKHQPNILRSLIEEYELYIDELNCENSNFDNNNDDGNNNSSNNNNKRLIIHSINSNFIRTLITKAYKTNATICIR